MILLSVMVVVQWTWKPGVCWWPGPTVSAPGYWQLKYWAIHNILGNFWTLLGWINMPDFSPLPESSDTCGGMSQWVNRWLTGEAGWHCWQRWEVKRSLQNWQTCVSPHLSIWTASYITLMHFDNWSITVRVFKGCRDAMISYQDFICQHMTFSSPAMR